MKNRQILIMAALLALGTIGEVEGAFIKIVPPEVVINSPQSVDVVIVDSQGKVYQQTAHYDPIQGGIDIDVAGAGANASFYVPSWKTGYVWYNGFWVDEHGYYWGPSGKVAINVPNWRNHWVGYWGKYWNDRRGFWPRGAEFREDAHDRYMRFHDRTVEQKQVEESKIKGFGEVNEMRSKQMESGKRIQER